METKKTVKADLEKGKTTGLLMGLVVATAILFVSFEWGTRDVKLLSAENNTIIEVVEMLPITRPETPPPPPPPAPVVTDILTVVEDIEDIKVIEVLTTEDTQGNAQKDIFVPSVAKDEEEVDDNIAFVLVEEMPEFPGGETGLLNYIRQSLRYPVIAQENGIQGRVVCSFVIDRNGKVTEAEVARSIDPALDKEALRVVNAMPNWKPGKQRGKPVRVKFTVPITFRLQ